MYVPIPMAISARPSPSKSPTAGLVSPFAAGYALQSRWSHLTTAYVAPSRIGAHPPAGVYVPSPQTTSSTPSPFTSPQAGIIVPFAALYAAQPCDIHASWAQSPETTSTRPFPPRPRPRRRRFPPGVVNGPSGYPWFPPAPL